MIVQMLKYSFLIYHRNYLQFLTVLQNAGVVHIVEKKQELSDEKRALLQEANTVKDVIKFLVPRKQEYKNSEDTDPAPDICKKIIALRSELDAAVQQKQQYTKEMQYYEPWGDFSIDTIEKLHKNGIHTHLYIMPRRSFKEEWKERYALAIIAENNTDLYLAIFAKEGDTIDIDVEEFSLQGKTITWFRQEIEKLNKKIAETEKQINEYAATAIKKMESYLAEITAKIDFHTAEKSGSPEAENTVMLIEGWVPSPKTAVLDTLLDTTEGIVYVKDDAKDEKIENIPVLLRNNSFARLFEPIGKLFSLPNVKELDLTPFFAPFFMMFFGFCLGDAGYGIVVLLGATLFKRKVSADFKPYFSLAQFLGIATIIFGAISGTLFGINLIEAPIAMLDNVRDMFLDSQKMFYLALIVGAIQIIFGMCLKAVNLTIQKGFAYALSTLGWLILIVGLIVRTILIQTGILEAEEKIVLHSLLGIAAVCILFLNDPSKNIFVRVGIGVWDVYGVVTGIFGDLLSYIRLFALGISSSILGLVINSISLQMKGIPYLGPVLFVLFLVVGHIANLLISTLGSFVHPMRLTFVEFYKNAGFSGGGKAYKPFTNKK